MRHGLFIPAPCPHDGAALDAGYGHERGRAYNRLNAIEAGIAPPRVVATAHAHTGRVYIDAAGVTVATYAWQALTRHGHKVVPSAVTTVGAHMLDWTNRPDREDPDVSRYQRTLNLEGSTLHA